MKRRWIKIGLLVGIIAVFLWLRFYNINNSLFFFNDMGRDAWVLQSWLLGGKPPLLGPQTSALPFNQSAIYFYLLYPLFILCNQSPLAPLITNAVLYVTSFIFCLWLARKDKILTTMLLVSYLLIAIHPQYIIQNRFIWNPSMVTPFVLAGFSCLYLLTKKENNKLIIGFAIAMAMAVSLSYSIAPLLAAMVMYLLVKLKNKIWLIASLAGAGLVINLPTIFFEIRHGFVLTNSIFNKQGPVQEGLDLATRINGLGRFGINMLGGKWDVVVLGLIAAWVIVAMIKSKEKAMPMVWLLSTVMMLAAPISLQPHYIFGFLVASFLIIGRLPLPTLLPILAVTAVAYLQPKVVGGYFGAAPRTYEQMVACFKVVCQKEKEPMFVSVQSSYHPFHHGPEHRFLLRQAGCKVEEIETAPGATGKMAVVVDGGGYDHGVTKYNELTMFGPSKVIDRYQCQENFGVVILEKEK